MRKKPKLRLIYASNNQAGTLRNLTEWEKLSTESVIGRKTRQSPMRNASDSQTST